MDNLKAAGLIVINYFSKLIFFDQNNDDEDNDTSKSILSGFRSTRIFPDVSLMTFPFGSVISMYSFHVFT